jgi:hypothetical protein
MFKQGDTLKRISDCNKGFNFTKDKQYIVYKVGKKLIVYDDKGAQVEPSITKFIKIN